MIKDSDKIFINLLFFHFKRKGNVIAMKKLDIGIGLVILVLIAIVAFIANPAGDIVNRGSTDSRGPIRIGMILPLTGNAADIGKSNKAAVEIAVDEINSDGGINGRRIELIIEDSIGCDAKTAVTAMQKLVNVDGVPAVYSICSGVALATHPIAEASGVVHFGGASNPDVRESGDYMFRIIPSDDFAGKVAAQYVEEEFNARDVAVIHCDNDWCVGIKEVFIESFESMGGNILIDEQIKAGTSDARTELTKIKNLNPDLVYFAGYPKETITVFRQARELGLDVPFFGGDGWLDQSIPEEAGNTAENKFFTTPASHYSKAFEEKVKGDIALCTVESYDIIYILADVMNRVGTNPEAIKNELYNLKNFKGESGIITLDEKGDLATASFDIMTFENGEIVDYESGIISK